MIPPLDPTPVTSDDAAKRYEAMKILHRYILREITAAFLLLIGVITIVLLIKGTYDTRDEIIEQDPAGSDVIAYIALSIPVQLTEILPLAAMLAPLIAMGMMARNREILGMISVGSSFEWLAIPVAIFGLGVAVATFGFSNLIAPGAQSRAEYLYAVKIKGENQYAFTSNDEIFRKGQGRQFYIMTNFDGDRKVMTRPSILEKNIQGGGLERRIEASEARLVSTSDDGSEQVWEFSNAEMWTFHEDGTVAVTRYTEPLRLQMEQKLDAFLSRSREPEEMSIGELREHTATIERQGGSRQLPVYRTGIQARVAVPLACLVLALIGFTLTADLQRHNVAIAVGIAIGVGLLYWFIRDSMIDLGGAETVSPFIAAWTPPLVFAAFAGFLFHRISTVR